MLAPTVARWKLPRTTQSSSPTHAYSIRGKFVSFIIIINEILYSKRVYENSKEVLLVVVLHSYLIPH